MRVVIRTADLTADELDIVVAAVEELSGISVPPRGHRFCNNLSSTRDGSAFYWGGFISIEECEALAIDMNATFLEGRDLL